MEVINEFVQGNCMRVKNVLSIMLFIMLFSSLLWGACWDVGNECKYIYYAFNPVSSGPDKEVGKLYVVAHTDDNNPKVEYRIQDLDTSSKEEIKTYTAAGVTRDTIVLNGYNYFKIETDNEILITLGDREGTGGTFVKPLPELF